jgi:hypothetical protein
MTGSSLAPIIIPIVVSISLAAWLIMVYYAASHPEWKNARPAPAEADPAPGPEAAGTPGEQPELPAAESDQLDGQTRHRDLVPA